MNPSVHIFWDNSNIFIEAKKAANRIEGLSAESGIRIQFDNLYNLAKAGRLVSKAICVGSVPPGLRRVWDRLSAAGVEVELFERGAQSGREQALDQALQVYMLRASHDCEPAVAVLLTGDGAGYDMGTGFHADLERMAKKGWGVEVLSWDRACRRALREWATAKGTYVPREDYYWSITFVEGGRPSRPLSLIHRRMATPSLPN